MTANLNKTIAVASDHAGYELKETIASYLREADYEVVDLGPHSDDRVDYPDFGYAMAKAIENGEAPRGVLVCGSGIGISIAANRSYKVRAALCCCEEMAILARQHNDANVIAFGARLIDEEQAIKSLELFLSTKFEGGRHEQRVEKLGKQ